MPTPLPRDATPGEDYSCGTLLSKTGLTLLVLGLASFGGMAWRKRKSAD